MNSLLSVDALRQLLVSSFDQRDESGTSESRALVHAAATPRDRFDALKSDLRRKRKRPVSLAPLESPQHSARAVESIDEDETHTERHQSVVPRSPERTSLPPLVVNVLERKRLFLDPHGEPVVGVEEILQLQEQPRSPLKLRHSPLQLIAVPRKVFEDDEVALMPCHTLHYRYVPSLEVERWKEPLRDRDKNWRDDELSMILATRGSGFDTLAETKMTRGPGNARRGTWRKLDCQRLQIKSTTATQNDLLGGGAIPTTTTTTAAAMATVPASPRDVSQPGEVLLRVQGAMISRTYCVVRIYGIGIYGRLYSEGLAERQGQSRFLRIDAYDPASSATHSLKVSLSDLEWVFEANPDLLAAGRKQAVLRKVVSLLYFEYPDDSGAAATTEPSLASPLSVVDASVADETPRQLAPSIISLMPIRLCISPHERLNEAARRRREREERLRRDEAERLRLLALLMKQPRRARHRVVVQLLRLSGHAFVVSIYHFPSQVRNFLVVAYHPRTSRTFTLAVGVREAATLSRVLPQPHTWSREQKTQIALALLPLLHLRASKSKLVGGEAPPQDEMALYRVALAIREDRMGAAGSWLALPVASQAVERKHDVVAKYTKDGKQELQLTLVRQLAELESDATTKHEQLTAAIREAETTLLALQQRDAELKELIEDINSGKSVVATDEAGAPTREQQQQHHHVLRRGHKAARKTIKDESKSLQAKVVAWKRELELAREHVVVEKEKVQTQYAKALAVLTQRAVTATLPQWFDPQCDRRAPLRPSQVGGNTQRRRLLRGEIGENGLSLASGACFVGGRRHRYSIVEELPLSSTSKSEKGDEDEEEVVDEMEWFVVSLYDAVSCVTRSLRLARLEWLALAKSQHDALLQIPALRVTTSPSVQEVAALDARYEATRTTLRELRPLKKNEKTKRQLMDELQKNRHARRVLWKDHAPWDKAVRALCERVRLSPRGELVVDRCIYRATMGIVSVANSEEGEDGDGVVDCEVWVTQSVHVVDFFARDLATHEEWSLAYPDSVELVKEFAVETPMELQLHLEAIAMTLLLYVEELDAVGTHESSEATAVKPRRWVRRMRFED